MKILIIKPSSLGDIVHTLPLAPLIRKKNPDAEISWIANQEYARLLDLCPEVDNVILFRRKHWNKRRYWPELLNFIRELRSSKADIAIDFQGLLRSALIARLSGAKQIVGFRNAREGAAFFYNQRVVIPDELTHALERNHYLLKSALDVDSELKESGLTSSKMDVNNREKLFITHSLKQKAPYITVAPAARWKSKTWPPAFFEEAIKIVWRKIPDLQVLIIGDESERSVGNQLFHSCRDYGRIVNLMGETELGTLVEILRHTQSMLTNDSGPMHLAAALGRPVVAVFGPTDPGKTGPYGNNHAIFRGQCKKAPCEKTVCPLGTATCQKTIKNDEVTTALIKIIQNQPE